MSDYNASYASDFFKDCFGVRPDPEQVETPEKCKELFLFCERWIENMKSTPAGRKTLIEDGWMLK